MSGKEMRLLHLTDLHMRHALAGSADRLKRLSRDIPANLERIAKRLEDWSPDVIVMTGDLLDVPDEVVDGSLLKTDPAGYQQSVEESAADYRWMREWLEATGLDWLVIPGNHDLRVAFHEVFGAALPDDRINGWRFIGFDDDLDEKRAPFRPAGEVSRFIGALEVETTSVPQVHLQHYILRPRVYRRSLYSHTPESGIVESIEQSGVVRCALSGHFHPGALCRNEKGITYSTAPAFCERPFPVRLVDFDRLSVTDVQDRTLD